ncbi:MAG: glycosyltransferase family 4 protein [bacterium]
MKKLAIISTHPIQYNAPLFRLLAESEKLDVHVFYTWSQAEESIEDAEFKQQIVWDIPLLEGYEYSFVENISTYPKQHFKGLVNPGLIPAIETWGADVVLVFGWNFQSHFKAMRYFKGKIPVWFRGDSTLLNVKNNIKGIIRYISLRWIYRFVDKAFYVGENNRHYFERYGLRKHQLRFAPHAVDNCRFGQPGSEEQSLQWRRELGYADNDIVIVYAGKFIKCKGLVSFVKQFKNYKDQYPKSNFELLLIGNGELEAELKSMQNNAIKFLTFQNQSKMPLIYCLGNIFVLPSNSETWGLGINEAMASGRAVIVTKNVGCAVDLVEDGKNGYYFDLENSEANIKMFKKIEHSNLKEIGVTNKISISKWSYKEIVTSIENAAYEKE